MKYQPLILPVLCNAMETSQSILYPFFFCIRRQVENLHFIWRGLYGCEKKKDIEPGNTFSTFIQTGAFLNVVQAALQED